MKVASIEHLQQWLTEMATLLDKNQEPDPRCYTHFLQEPEVVLNLVDLIRLLDETEAEDNQAYYSACVFAVDLCVAQLQSAIESGNKSAQKILDQLMSKLAEAIDANKHSLGFWLPVLNAFYDVHAELSDELKDAYLNLAAAEEELSPEEEVLHLDSIRELIHELSDLSVFDIAENFFAQSYAMPPDFFVDLLLDLYSIEEGHDIALLALLHPKQAVRDVVVATLDALMPNLTLTDISLARLQAIKHWYPQNYHEQFNRWIKLQRKKGVVVDGMVHDIAHHEQTPIIPSQRISHLKASEVDGSGAQGIFIDFRKNRQHRLGGLLFKQEIGIKDAWITPVIRAKDMTRYYDEAFDDSVMLRDVDLAYLILMTNHFLALTIEQGSMPELHLLEIQEELGLHFLPQKLDVDSLLTELGVLISPFTAETVTASFKRSKSWPKDKRFTESWFIENAQIDKLVNRCCSFVDGVKVCRFEEAIAAVFTEELEHHRQRWLFHFLWIALWMKAKARKNEKIWQDSFIIAHEIYAGRPLKEIPIMHEICHQSVINSIETMHERRTYLNQE